MSAFFVTILIFILASLVSSAAKRGQPPTGRSRIPWYPPDNIPDRRLREPWQQFNPWEQASKDLATSGSEDIDPEKAREISEADGKEGTWGDEGRPDMVQHRSQALKWSSQANKSENMRLSQRERASTPEIMDVVVTAVPPGEDQVPDLTLSPDQLAQAVVWAEILGKPRALRKFKASRY